MRKYFSHAMIILLLQYVNAAFAQQLKFNHVIEANTSNLGPISDIAQDQQGYIWLTIGNGSNFGRGGVYRYDGSKTIAFLHDPANLNSLANNWAECLFVDSSNMVWIGTYGSGLDRYDPVTNKFTHFKHDPKNATSLNNDTVTALLEDREGNFWIGTFGGLNLMDKKTGKFTHYTCDTNNAHSLSNNEVRAIYEDRQGTLWVGCGSVWDIRPEDGGLNRFDRSTGTFTRYLHDPSDPNSIVNNKVRAMFEDSKGNFWVGTAGDGLHILDRTKGTFTHYYSDSAHPEKLSRPPLRKGVLIDHITFIKEDVTGSVWIGTFLQGINRYDPITKKMTHYGFIRQPNRLISADTASGYKDFLSWTAFTSKEGLLWITTLTGNLYNVNPFISLVPYFPLKANANSFYKEPGTHVLWIATEQGLIRKDMNSGNVKTWRHDPHNTNSLCNDTIGAMRSDDAGNFWIATSNGLCKFDPNTYHFTNYYHTEKNKNSLSGNSLNNLLIDQDKNIWIATNGTGLDKLDTKTGVFTHFQSAADSYSLVNNLVISVCEDPNHALWIGTGRGASSLGNNGTKFKTYLKGLRILNIYVDAKGIVWAGTNDGLYHYDGSRDQFMPFTILGAQSISDAVLSILEDNDQNLWVAAANSIIKINPTRDGFKMYGERSGVHKNTFLYSDNFKSKEGELFLGDQEGYYAFFPGQLEDNAILPQLSFSGFRLGDELMQPGQGGVLKAPIWRTDEIKLKHDQNIFSFDFIAFHYGSAGETKYLFMLENYDNSWHNIGTDHTAYFFNVPPGNYIFHAKVISIDGTSAEKTISIIIMPPWWQTWWAYCIYVVLVIVIGLAVYRFIKQRIIQNEQEKARVKELAQAKEIEKAYHTLEQTHEALKATQAQLVQSEKMASLGELTAGIAHEIQNPLNFVNNFSEVNTELIAELKAELATGNQQQAIEIANDIADNEQKINHHGKRAGAIVKGMLQHSRTSSGKKEPTDINALCDEYLRLSYHGLRAKDKDFNATMKTDFDESIGKTNIVSQDIGRAILNLINNAFYAVAEKKKMQIENYEPAVSVITKKVGDKIQISVKDNGNGIPQKIVDKIFQPFFTTKPTGQGTGLGLSLSYDIVKAHGGEIRVESNEGKGSEFIIQLPIIL